jgi:hypothetical protein
VANCLPNFIIQKGVELQIIDYICKYLFGYDPTLESVLVKIKVLDFNDFLRELFSELQTHPEKEFLINFIKVLLADQNYQNLAGPSKHCGRVIYKPSNPQFATQGAVSSSNYILKKDVVTLETYYQNSHKTLPVTKSECPVKAGIRPSKFTHLVPELINRKYTPKLTR